MEIELCQFCKWYSGDLTCLAFPKRIPKDILGGENDHSQKIDGQNGNFVFEDRGFISPIPEIPIGEFEK